ncbi:MAG: tRNA (guanine(10)-N(2))-dimethyltransferase [Candidatus Aenigmatarchaeota archaeon]
MKLKKVQEGKIKLWIYPGRIYDVPVFYNPEMELSRDISVSCIQTFQKQSKLNLNICDALAGTGIRGLRYAKEISGIKKVVLNDKNPKAFNLIKKSIKLNKLSRKCIAKKGDANVLLHENVFNVIDIDPFGSPNIFLDSAARSIWHKGFLCVTATDTAPLSGTYPQTCFKKYGIFSKKTEYYSELGMRILISYIILTLAKRDRSFIPLLSHATRHYFRVFGKIEHLGKLRNILKQFKMFDGIGPIYLGKIKDNKFCKEVLKDLQKRDFKLGKQEERLLKLIISEIDVPFYYDLHRMRKKQLPKIDEVIKKLKKKGFKASRTHFCLTGIKTNANIKFFK